MTRPRPVSADGVKGLLLWSGENFYFRVHDYANSTFKDYSIAHSDLSITIDDADAFLYPPKEGSERQGVLDYSPSTLGLTDMIEEQMNADFAAMRESLATENVDLK